MRSKVEIACVAFFLFNVGYGGGVVQGNEADGSNAASHQSSRAYPDAVLSATDADSGITVAVDQNGTGLTATDKSGKVLWRTEVVKEIGAPEEGSAVVRHVSMMPNGAVSLVLGKNRYAEADLRTGKVTLLGED